MKNPFSVLWGIVATALVNNAVNDQLPVFLDEGPRGSSYRHRSGGQVAHRKWKKRRASGKR